MSDNIGRSALELRLRRDVEEFWSIVQELLATPESERARILRWHEETGLTYKDDMPLMAKRMKFDAVLGALTLLEIAYETGITDMDELAPPRFKELSELFQSEAVLQYANAYLYFGVRFLAARMNPASILGQREHPNQRPFFLAYAPAVGYPEQNAVTFRRLLDLDQASNPTEISSSGSPQTAALLFLDDFVPVLPIPGETRPAVASLEDFELWLRGLSPDIDGARERYFDEVRRGLTAWSIDHCRFYMSLQSSVEMVHFSGNDKTIYEEGAQVRPAGGWQVTNPVAARYGLLDVYWIARLLRADVTSEAAVRYTESSWLSLLRVQAELRGDRPTLDLLQQAEEVLRAVFGFVCDLVQNSVEITKETECEAYDPGLRANTPRLGTKWRDALNEELTEIERQRDRRKYRSGSPPRSLGAATASAMAAAARGGWLNKFLTRPDPPHLVGVAFSGGGIRSATFNLGVLQALQELDVLRYVDYLSTVSGGGFVGAWLVANVERTRHWLARRTCWDDSIAHLRRYSNYLAPESGLLSSDTWTMVATWVRNASLIQLTGLTWLFTLLLSSLACHALFEIPSKRYFPRGPTWNLNVQGPQAVAALMGLLVLYTILSSLIAEGSAGGPQSTPAGGAAAPPASADTFSELAVQKLAVIPALIGSFVLASLLWAWTAQLTPVELKAQSYSFILSHAWPYWKVLLIVLWVAFCGIGLATLALRKWWHAIWIGTLCVASFYLQLCAIVRLFVPWAASPDHFGWYAFVFGPGLVLAAHTVSFVLFIGLSGRNSNQSLREWWTRFGAWLAIYGAGTIALAVATVFGPLWILLLLHAKLPWSLSAIVGWIVTVAGGLFSGKSSKTAGKDAETKSQKLEILAKAGGLLFIVGAVLIAATIVYAVLVNIGTDANLLPYWTALSLIPLKYVVVSLGVTLLCGMLFSWFFEINVFGLNQFYRNRLVRCYLGASRWAPGERHPQPFTKFDGHDDMRLKCLSTGASNTFRGPFPIFNCALNLGGSSDLALHTRHSASFSLTPLWCGADRPKVGYARTAIGSTGFADGVMLGQAVAISGAAASPNMGYNTSPLVAFLLTMFNVRLGWWFPNPGREERYEPGLRFSLYYLLQELFGLADERSAFVNVSDGGHFENLGIYELVRRRCQVIIACDAECDETLQFGGLGNLVRICETDFGAIIDIDVSSIRQQGDGLSSSHCTVGKITYSNGTIGHLIYLKASVTGDEEVGIAQYRSIHRSFPHETTADQFFSEDQFESYRKLGQHVVRHSFRGIKTGEHPAAIAERLADVLVPAGGDSGTFVKHTEVLDQIWERFRQEPALHPFLDELMLGSPTLRDSAVQHQELAMGLEIIQLMENVFLDLRLDDFWKHPDNRGWAILFSRWARSPRLREAWERTRNIFGIRFEYFCAARLGLPKNPRTVRV